MSRGFTSATLFLSLVPGLLHLDVDVARYRTARAVRHDKTRVSVSIAFLSALPVSLSVLSSFRSPIERFGASIAPLPRGGFDSLQLSFPLPGASA